MLDKRTQSQSDSTFLSLAKDMETGDAYGTAKEFIAEVRDSISPEMISTVVADRGSELVEVDGLGFESLLPDVEIRDERLILDDADDSIPTYDEIIFDAKEGLGVSEEALTSKYTEAQYNEHVDLVRSKRNSLINTAIQDKYGSWVPEFKDGGFELDSVVLDLDTDAFGALLKDLVASDKFDTFLKSVWDDPESLKDAFTWEGDDFEFLPSEVDLVLEEFLDKAVLGNWTGDQIDA